VGEVVVAGTVNPIHPPPNSEVTNIRCSRIPVRFADKIYINTQFAIGVGWGLPGDYSTLLVGP